MDNSPFLDYFPASGNGGRAPFAICRGSAQIDEAADPAVHRVVPASSRAAGDALRRHAELGAAMILRTKPAVVGVITEVSAEVTIR